MPDPLSLANRIGAFREIDAATERWLIDGFAAWWQDGSDPARLVQCLRLPAGTRAALIGRNRWLCIAAEEPPGLHRAAALKRAVDAFMDRQWPAWRQESEPPAESSALHRALFFAAAGAPMDMTRRQLSNILNGK